MVTHPLKPVAFNPKPDDRQATPCALPGCVAYAVKGGPLCAVHAARIWQRCWHCHGSGLRLYDQVCAACGGTGLADTKEEAL